MATRINRAAARSRPPVLRLRRQRALHRQVSLRRRIMGFGFLMVVLGLWGAFHWHTRDGYVRDKAVAYLESFLGASVSIGSAEFSVFNGINLHDVVVYTPGWPKQQRELFRADEALLQLKIAPLLSGRLVVTEILAARPLLHLIEDLDNQKWNYQDLGGSVEIDRESNETPPSIRLRDGRLRRSYVIADKMLQSGEWPIDGKFKPHPTDADLYVFVLDTPRSGAPTPTPSQSDDSEAEEKYILSINVTTGKVEQVHLEELPLTDIQDALPERMRAWLKDYNLDGEFGLSVNMTDGSTGNDPMEAEFSFTNVSMTLPVPQTGPLVLRNAHGVLRLRQDRIVIPESQPLSGELEGRPVKLWGAIDGSTASDAGVDLHLHISEISIAKIREDYADVEAMGKFFRSFEIDGAVNLQLHLNKQPGREAVMHVNGVATTDEMRVSYLKFPYTLENCTGRIEFTREMVDVVELTGTHGDVEVTISGMIGQPGPEYTADLLITTKNGTLDDDLYAALQHKHKQIWDQFAPAGPADARVRVIRNHQTNLKYQVQVDAELKDVIGRYERFALPLEKVRGRLSFDPKSIQIDQIVAEHESGRVYADGDLLLAGDNVAKMELKLSAEDMPLDEALGAALPPAPAKLYRMLNARGRGNLQGVVTKDRGGELQYDFDVEIYGNEMQFEPVPYPVEQIIAQLKITPGNVRIQHGHGQAGGGRINLTGNIQIPEGQAPRVELSYQFERLALDKTLYKVLPTESQQWWDQLSPRGWVDVFGTFRRDGDGADYRCRIVCRDVAVTFDRFPYPMENIDGQIIIKPGNIQLDHLVSEAPPRSIELNGKIRPVGDGHLNADLTLVALDVPIDEKIRTALQSVTGASNFINAIQSTGAVHLELAELKSTTQADGKVDWHYSGQLTLLDAAVKMGSHVQQINGTFNGQGDFDALSGRVGYSGDVKIDKMQLGRRQISRLTATAEKLLNQDVLTLGQIEGQCYGGQMAGDARFEFSGTPTYEMRLNFDGLSLEPLVVESMDQPPSRPVTGKLNAQMLLRGTSGIPASRQGKGSFVIGNARIMDLPFVLSLLQALEVNNNAFDAASGQYQLNGQIVLLDKIELRGPSLNLFGNGELKLSNNELKMTLITKDPGDFNDVPALAQMLEGLNREIMEVQVTGTLTAPLVKTQPLRSINGVLKKLLETKPYKKRR